MDKSLGSSKVATDIYWLLNVIAFIFVTMITIFCTILSGLSQTDSFATTSRSPEYTAPHSKSSSSLAKTVDLLLTPDEQIVNQ